MKISLRRQIVGQELDIQVRGILIIQHLVAHHAEQYGQQQQQPEHPAVVMGPAEHRHPGMRATGIALPTAGQRPAPAGPQGFDGRRRQPAGALVERLGDLGDEFLLVHKRMPFSFNLADNVFTARKQWVLTLPSEHPITLAVSAMSISSQ